MFKLNKVYFVPIGQDVRCASEACYPAAILRRHLARRLPAHHLRRCHKSRHGIVSLGTAYHVNSRWGRICLPKRSSRYWDFNSTCKTLQVLRYWIPNHNEEFVWEFAKRPSEANASLENTSQYTYRHECELSMMYYAHNLSNQNVCFFAALGNGMFPISN